MRGTGAGTAHVLRVSTGGTQVVVSDVRRGTAASVEGRPAGDACALATALVGGHGVTDRRGP